MDHYKVSNSPKARIHLSVFLSFFLDPIASFCYDDSVFLEMIVITHRILVLFISHIKTAFNFLWRENSQQNTNFLPNLQQNGTANYSLVFKFLFIFIVSDNVVKKDSFFLINLVKNASLAELSRTHLVRQLSCSSKIE